MGQGSCVQMDNDRYHRHDHYAMEQDSCAPADNNWYHRHDHDLMEEDSCAPMDNNWHHRHDHRTMRLGSDILAQHSTRDRQMRRKSLQRRECDRIGTALDANRRNGTDH